LTPKAREYLGRVGNIRLEKPFDRDSFREIVNERVRRSLDERGRRGSD